MYAIVRTGGKQYRVEEGRSVDVELLPAEEGSRVEIEDVLLIADDGEVTVGTPTIEGARVVADVEAHGRNKKIVVFKYKAKTRTRKKTGHRQHFTRLAVTEILKPGQKPKPRRKARAKKEEAAEAAPVDAEEAVAAAPAAEAEEKPKRAARKPAAKPKAEAKTPTEEAEGEEKPAARKAPAKKKAAAKRKPAARKPAASKAKAGDGDEEEKKPARRRTTRAKASAKKDDEE